MFKETVIQLLGVQEQEIIKLALAILDLIEQLLFNNQVNSNTNLAVIAESQGLEIVRSNGVTANHLNSLIEGVRAVTNSKDRVTNLILPIQKANRPVGDALFEVLRPLMDRARDTVRICTNTINSLPEIARTNSRRLEGVAIETGERGRQSSVVQQMANDAVQLRQRGIDPELVENATDDIRKVISEAESLPADERESVLKLTPVVVSMLQLIRVQLSFAVGEVRAALLRLLGPLETMLNFIARAFGGRLTSFILIPKFILDNMVNQVHGNPQGA